MDMQRREWIRASATLATLGLVGCGGGGSEADGDGPVATDPPAGGNELPPPLLSGAPTAAAGLQTYQLGVASADAGSTYSLQADLGAGVVVDVEPLAGSSAAVAFQWVAPVGVFDADRNLRAGVVTLTLTRRQGAKTARSTQAVSVDMPGSSGASGVATLRWLRAVQLNAQQSLANFGIIASKLPGGLGLNDQAAAVNRLREQLAGIETAVLEAQAGRPAVLNFGTGAAVPLTATLLRQLDAFAAAATTRLAPTASSGPSASRKMALATAADDDEVELVRGLARDYANDARQVAKRVKDVVGLGAAIVGAGALLAGSPAVALAAGGIAATAWFVSTAFGTGVGALVDGGSARLLDGQASWKDFAPSGKFFVDQYLDLAKDTALSMFAKLPANGQLAPVIDIGANALTTYESLNQSTVQPAIASGQLSATGYPPSTFDLRVTANANPYVVVALAIPAASARIRLQISGTDGYVFNRDAELIGGQASFNPEPASPGSGVVDTINVFDLDGRATASTSVRF